MSALIDGVELIQAGLAGAESGLLEGWAVVLVPLVALLLAISRVIQDTDSASNPSADRVLDRDLEEREDLDQTLIALLSSIGEGVGVLRADRRLAFANPLFQQLFEREPGERCHVGRDETCDLCLDLDDALQRHAPKERTLEHKARTLELSTSLLPSAGDEPSLMLIVRDVTERKLLEESLRHAQRMDSVGTLAGGIAHDFNNLLQGILGYASVLQSGLDKDSPLLETAVKIKTTASRAAELSGQLRTLARNEPPRREPVDIGALLKETTSLLERTLLKEISIDLQLAPDLPAVEGDSSQLLQVLLNLAVNARDAMHGGGILTLTAHAVDLDERACRSRPGLSAGPHVLLRVSDTGIGMDQGILEHLFDPFFTTKERGHGTGLGCTIAYHIVLAHNGTVEVHSAPGKGTTFGIYLPATQRKVKARVPEKLELKGGHETILVVDDEDFIRELAHHILRRCGYHTLDASDGVQALEIFGQHRDTIDLVLLDLAMPRLGGREAARRIRHLRPDIRILFSTGNDEIDGGIGEFRCVQKPYKIEHLAAAVRACLDQRVET